MSSHVSRRSLLMLHLRGQCSGCGLAAELQDACHIEVLPNQAVARRLAVSASPKGETNREIETVTCRMTLPARQF